MLNTDTLQPIPPARPKRENRFNKPAGEILALLATELQALKESLTEQSVALKHQADLLELTYDAILEAEFSVERHADNERGEAEIPRSAAFALGALTMFAARRRSAKVRC